MRRLALGLTACSPASSSVLGALGALFVIALVLPSSSAIAAPGSRSSAKAEPSPQEEKAAAAACLAELDRRQLSYRRVVRRGIAIPVEITGLLGGLAYPYHEAFVIDCSLAVSLDEAGRYLRDLGFTSATVASAHSRRNVRGTNRPSKHSFGLAVDIPALTGPEVGTLRLDRDYEQGLGDDVDCVGAPLTAGGELLKIAQCQLARSGLFYLVLSPDYDDAHYDHFHLEARPWTARDDLRAATPAIH